MQMMKNFANKNSNFEKLGVNTGSVKVGNSTHCLLFNNQERVLRTYIILKNTLLSHMCINL